MTGRLSRAQVAAIVLLCAVGVTGVVVAFATGSFADVRSIVGVLFGVVTIGAVGLVLTIRVPSNRVSWVVLAVAAGMGVFLGSASIERVGTYFLGSVAVYGSFFLGLGVLIPLWFPTGRPPSPRWRWVSWFAIGSVTVTLGGVAVWMFGGGGDAASQLSCATPSLCAATVGTLGLVLSVAAAVTSLIVRFVRAGGEERLQLKWFTLAFSIFLVGVIAEVAGFSGSIGVALLIPIAIGVAISRYRLYEIDRIVSRTVTYSLVGLVVGVIYVIPVVTLPTFLGQSSDLVVAGSTLAAAAVFAPARRRIQRAIDRRFDRARYDAAEAVARFSSTLHTRVEIEALRRDLAAITQTTLSPATATVWLRQG